MRAELDAALAGVLDSGWYILGQQGEAFEREFAAWCGAAHGVGVGSGTDALRIALLALGVQPGDEVITVANAGIPPVAAIVAVGARPVFADVTPTTHTLDPDQAATAITARTRALLVVHLYGHPADMDPLLALARQHGLLVLEDCAQAHGARYKGRLVGTLGHAAAFSFYPTKNLGALGDAGLVLTSDAAIAERARLLRNYGWRQQYQSELLATASRLDELQAAVLRAKLPHLECWNRARRERAAWYRELLRGLPLELPGEMPWAEHVYHLYVARTPARDALRAALSRQGVGSGIHYPTPAHLQPPYAPFGRGPGSLPVTEQLAQEIVSLPMFPELERPQIEQVAAAVRAAGLAAV